MIDPPFAAPISPMRARKIPAPRNTRRHLPTVEPLEPRQLLTSAFAHHRTAPPHMNNVDIADSLQSVSFGGKGFRAITSDVAPDFPTHSNDQWQGGHDAHRWPVLYAADSKLTLSAEWEVSKSTFVTGEVLARATTSNGLTLPATPLKKEGGKLVLPPLEVPAEKLNPHAAAATTPFGNEARFFPHFTIQWQLSFDNGKSWSDAGRSDNPLYVSASTNPLADAKSHKFYLTVVDSAINQNLGLTAANRAEIVSKTWGLFTGLAVKQFSPDTPFSGGSEHGDPLTYYGTPASPTNRTRQQVEQFDYTLNNTVPQLLEHKDAQCTAWAELFLDMLLVNGIHDKDDLVTVNPEDARGFLVNNWTFIGEGTNRNKEYPYLDDPKTDHFDVIKNPGVPGQNSPDPLAVFGNHVIASIDGTLYDPSYGRTYANFRQMTDEDVAGFLNIVNSDTRTLEIQKPSATGQRLKLDDSSTWLP